MRSVRTDSLYGTDHPRRLASVNAVRESLRQGATQIKLMAGGGISSEYDPIDTVLAPQVIGREDEVGVGCILRWQEPSAC